MNLLVTLDRDESGMIVAECPSIPGCVSQGKTEDEALGNIREAIQACLEARAENGLPLCGARGRGHSVMPALPVVSGEKAVRAFVRAGWHVDR